MRYGRRIAGVRATLASRSVGFEKLLPLAAAGDAALQAVRRALLGSGGFAGWSVGARERCVLQVNGKGHPYTDPRRRKARHTPRTIATAPHTVWLIDLRPESSAMSWVGGRGAEGQSNTPLAARSVWLCKGRAPAPGVRVSTCPGACLLRVHLDNIGQLPQAAVIHVLLLPLPVHKAAWRRGRGVGCGWQQRCKGDPAFQSSRV